MSRTRLLRFLLPLFVLLLGLGLLELATRFLFARPTMHLGFEMWKYARDVKVIHPNPEIGHRHRPNASAFLMGVQVHTNSLGLRNREITLAKPPGTTRILVLGDSITFGWGCPQDETFCARLEAALNQNPLQPGRKYEIVNTGVGNSNTAMEATWFEEEGWKYQPDLVLLGWFINDAEPTPIPSHNWFAYHSYAFVFFDSAFDALLRRSSARQDYRAYYAGLYREDQPGWPKCQRAFHDLGQFCAERKIPIRTLLIPELHSLRGHYEFTDIHRQIAALAAASQMPAHELLTAFPEQGTPSDYWVSPTDAHPNSAGHALMAAEIERFLREP